MQTIAEEQKKYIQFSAQKDMKKALDVRNSIEKNKIKLQADSTIAKWEISNPESTEPTLSTLLTTLKSKSQESDVKNKK